MKKIQIIMLKYFLLSPEKHVDHAPSNFIIALPKTQIFANRKIETLKQKETYHLR